MKLLSNIIKRIENKFYINLAKRVMLWVDKEKLNEMVNNKIYGFQKKENKQKQKKEIKVWVSRDLEISQEKQRQAEEEQNKLPHSIEKSI